jgi:hypothetical protein
VVSFTPPYLFTLKDRVPWYPFYRRLGGPQSRSGSCGEEKNFLLLPGIKPRLLVSNFMKIRTGVLELLRADMAKLIFLTFFTAANNVREIV